MSWPDRGHHVPALTVTSGGRDVGFDMHVWGRLTIAHSRRLLNPRVSRVLLLFLFSSFVFPLRPFVSGFSLGRVDPLRLLYAVRRYGRRPGQPSSSSLARRASVHFDFVRVRVFIEYMAIDALKFASTPGTFGGRGDTPRWGLMAGAAACCAQFFRCSPSYFPVQP